MNDGDLKKDEELSLFDYVPYEINLYILNMVSDDENLIIYALTSKISYNIVQHLIEKILEKLKPKKFPQFKKRGRHDSFRNP